MDLFFDIYSTHARLVITWPKPTTCTTALSGFLWLYVDFILFLNQFLKHTDTSGSKGQVRSWCCQATACDPSVYSPRKTHYNIYIYKGHNRDSCTEYSLQLWTHYSHYRYWTTSLLCEGVWVKGTHPDWGGSMSRCSAAGERLRSAPWAAALLLQLRPPLSDEPTRVCVSCLHITSSETKWQLMTV